MTVALDQRAAAGLEPWPLTAVACPLCGADEPAMLYEDRNRREGLPIRSAYRRCGNCSLIYLNPVVGDLRALYVAVYAGDATAASTSGGRWSGRYAALLARCERLFDRSDACRAAELATPVGRMLDVGCSDGARLRAFADAGWDVHGIDPNPAAIDAARAGGRGTFVAGELTAHRYSDHCFDLVRIDNALEHVLDPHALLGEVRRILKPGGRLYIYVPNGSSLTMRWLGRYSISSWVPFHVALYTPATMTRLLAAHGFSATISVNTPLSWLYLSLKQRLSRRPFLSQMTLSERTAALLLGPMARLLNHTTWGEELVVHASLGHHSDL